MPPLNQYELFDPSPDVKGETSPDDHPTRPAEQETPDACYWDYCPNCGSRLHNHGCKYRCPRCHYFMSCSDFD
jgi:hypothetical protein